MSLTPEVLWAQRSSASNPEKNFVYLTISVPDVPASAFSLDLTATTVKFTGTSNTLKKMYAVELTLFDEIDTEASKINHTAKNIELKLQKKELKEEYWPRLLKDKAKMHFLKTDFDKWVDEDEQDEAPEEDFSQFGGMGGMPGMGGMGGDFGGIDFSKLGGGAPMDDDEDEGSDDDEMPALEGEALEGEDEAIEEVVSAGAAAAAESK